MKVSANLPRVIYFMGPPGAGKGTQAQLLTQHLGYHRFSTGDAFRALTREDSDLGRQVKDIIDNGFLCPPELAAEVVINAVKKILPTGQGIIFDGTPRTLVEAKIVDKFFVEAGVGEPLAIFLKIDRAEMEERNSKRRFCLDISGDFSVASPEDEARCISLGGRVGIRPDDEPAKFEKRWQQFMDLTWPVVEYYRPMGRIHEINGKQSAADVERDVIALIEEFSKD